MLLAGENFIGEQFSGNQPHGCPRVREGHEAAGQLVEFSKYGFAVFGDRLPANFPASRSQLRISLEEPRGFLCQLLDDLFWN